MENITLSTFVLVSGAWHAAWCWERVVPLLEANGHKVLAPNLYGMGPDTTPLADITLARWADQVAELIRDEPDPVILVGHSRGGIVISETAERVPDQIQRLIYLSAVLIPSGGVLEAAVELDGPDQRRSLLTPGPDNSTTIPPELAGQLFYSTTPEPWVERAISRLCPEPMVVFATPLSLSSERFGSVPRAYIECAEDQALPLEFQRRFQSSLPCAPVITLSSDHSPFFSAPEELVVALEIAIVTR